MTEIFVLSKILLSLVLYKAIGKDRFKLVLRCTDCPAWIVDISWRALTTFSSVSLVLPKCFNHQVRRAESKWFFLL